MELSAIPDVAVAFKTLTDTVRSVRALRTQAEVDSVREDLLAKLVAAHQIALELQAHALDARKTCEQLEKEVRRLKDFRASRERYELIDLGGGAFAYTLKEEYQSEEPEHHVCALCFEKAERSILQFERNLGRSRVLVCHGCGGQVRLERPGGRAQRGIAATRARSIGF